MFQDGTAWSLAFFVARSIVLDLMMVSVTLRATFLLIHRPLSLILLLDGLGAEVEEGKWIQVDT